MTNLSIFQAIIVFVFGLAIGSFLNVVIFRWESGENLGGRSHCPKCKKTLSWYELVPVFSFLLQKGKCRACRERISIQYPLVETLTGVIFVLLFFHFYGQWLEMLLWFVAAAILVVLFVTDLKFFVLPDRLMLPLVGGLFFIRTGQLWYSGQWGAWWIYLGSSFILALPFFLFWFFSRGTWMGMGDSKLILALGMLLGWPANIVGVFLAVMFGSMVGVVQILMGQKKLKSMIPFGPFLIFGSFLALYFGVTIYLWYTHTFIF